MSEHDDSLKEALKLTHKMLELAQKGEWVDVMELEKKQSALLRVSFEPGSPYKEGHAASKELVQEILALHEKIFEEASHFGSHIKEELSKLQKGRDANRAYLSHSE